MKRTIAVPSLTRLSPSVRTPRRFGAPRLLKSATTAVGSVAAISAEKTRACDHPQPLVACITRELATSNADVTPIAASTPGTASEKMVHMLRRNSEKSRLYAASKRSPGRKTRRAVPS